MSLCLYIVVLERTSPSPVCPGDNVIFTCTVTASSNPTLTWINPKNESDNRKAYTATSVSDGYVGDFFTQLIGSFSGGIVSTATLLMVAVKDDGSQGITCRDTIEIQTMTITLSGAWAI